VYVFQGFISPMSFTSPISGTIKKKEFNSYSTLSFSSTIQKYLEKYAIFEVSIKINIFLLKIKIFLPFYFILFYCEIYVVLCKRKKKITS